MKRLNRQVFLTEMISFLIWAMWMYAAVSKLWDIDKARGEMLNQVFPLWISRILVWAVPISEIVTASLLPLARTRRFGLTISLILLTAFTGYILIVMTGIFGRIPCSCGGILEQMSWGQHLLFNLFFMALTFIAIRFQSIKVKAESGELKLKRKEAL